MEPYCNHSPASLCRSLERWTTWTQHDIDSDKTIVDTVNALIAVAAFIAGVQGQIIFFSLSLDQTMLGRATNVLGFVGLVLDVIGTFLGVIHAIILQRRIKGNTAVLSAITQTTNILQAIQKHRDDATPSPDKISQEQLRDIGIEDPDDQFQRAQQLLRSLKDHFRTRNVLGPFGLAETVRKAVVLTNPAFTIQPITETMIKSLFGLGRAPLFAMGLGVLSLIASTIMYAAESAFLTSEVWVACVAVLGAFLGLSLLPVTYETAKGFFFPDSTDRLPL